MKLSTVLKSSVLTALAIVAMGQMIRAESQESYDIRHSAVSSQAALLGVEPAVNELHAQIECNSKYASYKAASPRYSQAELHAMACKACAEKGLTPSFKAVKAKDGDFMAAMMANKGMLNAIVGFQLTCFGS